MGLASRLMLKLKRFKKIAWIWSHHLQVQWKFKWLAGKFSWDNKAKHCWVYVNKIFVLSVWWQSPAMFCPYTSSKLSHPWFEFSLKVKVMGLNLGYLFKSFLLYLKKVILLQNGFQPIALWEIKQSVALLRSDHWSGKINISDAVSSNLLHQLIKMKHSGIRIHNGIE